MARPSKKTIIRILLIGAGGLAFVALLVAAGGLLLPEEEKELAPPLRRPEAVEYKTHTVTKSVIENTISCQGYFYPEKQVDVAFSNREGFLKAINVRFGQFVAAGQELASLDSDTLANEIKRQTLALEEARENHAKLQAIAVPDVAASKLELDELRRELEVKRQLTDGLPQSEILKMELSVRKQEYALQKLTLEYDYRIRTAAREIDAARLKLKELELELEKSVLRAPVAGRVVYVAPLNQGERVPPYKTMVSLADPRRLIVRYIGDQYDKFRLGMKVKVMKEGKSYPGEVILTPQQVPEEEFEKMKETVYVRAAVPAGAANVDDAAAVEATLERAENVIVLPRRLVHTYGGRSFVKVLDDGMVNERDVTTGIESNLEFEIKSGLAPGELVVE